MTLRDIESWRSYYDDSGELPQDVIESLFLMAEWAIENGYESDIEDEEQ